jgi:hypothetical protein
VGVLANEIDESLHGFHTAGKYANIVARQTAISCRRYRNLQEVTEKQGEEFQETKRNADIFVERVMELIGARE